MSENGLTISTCLREISTRLTEATALSRAALTCAETGSDSQAVRIAMDLDETLHEVADLHSAMRLIGRLQRGDPL